MTSPEKKQPSSQQKHKPAPTTPVHPADQSGHPAPKPPASSRQPAATTPKDPIANALLGVVDQVSAVPHGGRMGPTNSAPQVPAVPKASPVGMTAPVEERTDENAERTGESAANAKSPKQPPRRQPSPPPASGKR